MKVNKQELIGARFGRWTILEILDTPTSSGNLRARCKCDCGTEKVVVVTNLRQGISTSCGCYARELSSARGAIDLTGRRFGQLTALYKTDKRYQDGSIVWHCRCDCGREKDIPSRELLSGTTRTCSMCGFAARRVSEANTIYQNDTERRIVHTLNGMCQRCENPNSKDYCRYGARGITVCAEWRNDKLAFVRWALANGYQPGLSIERIDVNKGYSPDNCMWIPMSAQYANRRCNIRVPVGDTVYSVAECARILGITHKEAARLQLDELGSRTEIQLGIHP